MRQRLLPDADGDETVATAPEARRRGLDEISRLGPLYGTLNQLAPLARLAALLAWAFGREVALLSPVMASVAAGVAQGPLKKAAGALTGLAPDEVAAAPHQKRLLVTQALRLALFVALCVLSYSFTNAATLGLDASASPTHELGVGLAAGLAAAALGYALPRALGVRRHGESLAMEPSNDNKADLALATDDELVRTMAAAPKALYTLLKACALGLDAAADTVLFLRFLAPEVVFYTHGHFAPGRPTNHYEANVELYTGALGPPELGGLALAALCYGSQHLRWRGEWILATAFAAALAAAARAYGGSLLAPLAGAVAFAVVRHLYRDHDVRRFHKSG